MSFSINSSLCVPSPSSSSWSQMTNSSNGGNGSDEHPTNNIYDANGKDNELLRYYEKRDPLMFHWMLIALLRAALVCPFNYFSHLFFLFCLLTCMLCFLVVLVWDDFYKRKNVDAIRGAWDSFLMDFTIFFMLRCFVLKY